MKIWGNRVENISESAFFRRVLGSFFPRFFVCRPKSSSPARTLSEKISPQAFLSRTYTGKTAPEERGSCFCPNTSPPENGRTKKCAAEQKFRGAGFYLVFFQAAASFSASIFSCSACMAPMPPLTSTEMSEEVYSSSSILFSIASIFACRSALVSSVGSTQSIL